MDSARKCFHVKCGSGLSPQSFVFLAPAASRPASSGGNRSQHDPVKAVRIRSTYIYVRRLGSTNEMDPQSVLTIKKKSKTLIPLGKKKEHFHFQVFGFGKGIPDKVFPFEARANYWGVLQSQALHLRHGAFPS